MIKEFLYKLYYYIMEFKHHNSKDVNYKIFV